MQPAPDSGATANGSLAPVPIIKRPEGYATGVASRICPGRISPPCQDSGPDVLRNEQCTGLTRDGLEMPFCCLPDSEKVTSDVISQIRRMMTGDQRSKEAYP